VKKVFLDYLQSCVVVTALTISVSERERAASAAAS